MHMVICNKMWTYGQERHNAMLGNDDSDDGNAQL